MCDVYAQSPPAALTSLRSALLELTTLLTDANAEADGGSLSDRTLSRLSDSRVAVDQAMSGAWGALTEQELLRASVQSAAALAQVGALLDRSHTAPIRREAFDLALLLRAMGGEGVRRVRARAPASLSYSSARQELLTSRAAYVEARWLGRNAEAELEITNRAERKLIAASQHRAAYREWEASVDRDALQRAGREHPLPPMSPTQKAHYDQAMKQIHERNESIAQASGDINITEDLDLASKVRWNDVSGALAEGECAVEIFLALDRPALAHGQEDSERAVSLVLGAGAEPIIVDLGASPRHFRGPMPRNAARAQASPMRGLGLLLPTPTVQVSATGAQLGALLERILRAAPQCKRIFAAGDAWFLVQPWGTAILADGRAVREVLDLRLVTSTRDVARPKRGTMQLSHRVKPMAVLLGAPDYEGTPIAMYGTYGRQTAQRLEGLPPMFEHVPDLPFTQVEVDNIRALLSGAGWDVHAATGPRVTKMFISANQPRLLHIATHGVFAARGSNPEDLGIWSGLLLTGASRQGLDRFGGGFLTAYEIGAYDLRWTELVVLSACETGLGAEIEGEGVASVARAFEVAGTQNVLFTLWRIPDDATQKLMTAFYKNWLEGLDKHEALWRAQRGMRDAGMPIEAWAGFVMLGR